MKKILICLLMLCLLTGCGKDNTKIKNQDFKAKDPLSENISMKSITVQDNLILFITNNNKESIDMKITVDFYDKSEKVIDTNEDIFSAILNKKEIAIPFGIYEDYEYYKVTIESEKSNYINYEDSIKLSESKDDENQTLLFEVHNKSDKDVGYLDLTVIYYYNDEVIGVDNDFSGTIKAGEKTELEVSYPVSSNMDTLKFNNYKVYINEACTYNKEIKDED